MPGPIGILAPLLRTKGLQSVLSQKELCFTALQHVDLISSLIKSRPKIS